MMNKKYLQTSLLSIGLLLLVFNMSAEESKIYQQNSAGNKQYHKPAAVIQKDGLIIETDSVGNMQYHKQQYQIKDGKVYQTDAVGNIQYHKPHGVIK